MTATSIQNVYIVSDTTEALAAFYRTALNLQLKFSDGQRWIQLSDGRANFAIASSEEAGEAVKGQSVVFRVTDLDGTQNQILSNGGTLVGVRDMGDHGRVATFRDPQGNVFQVLGPAST